MAWQADDSAQDGDHRAIKAQINEVNGRPRGAEFLVNGEASGYQTNPNIASLPDSGFVVTCVTGDATQDGNLYGIKAQIFAADGGQRGSELLVNSEGTGSQCGPQVIGLYNGNLVAIWGTNDPAQDGILSAVKAQIFRTAPTNGDDLLTGVATGDAISALGGDDTVAGLGGDDSLNGGRGNDDLDGGDDNDTLNGGKGNDTLNGDDGDDLLDGGVGNDVLIGWIGSDTLTGGTGADTFTMKGGEVSDMITDFEVGIDTLNLRNTGVGDFAVDVMQSDDHGDRLLTWTDGGDTHVLTLEGLAGVTIDVSDVCFESAMAAAPKTVLRRLGRTGLRSSHPTPFKHGARA